VARLELLGASGVIQPGREAAVENQMADAFGMPHRIRDGDRRATRDAKQHEAIERRGVDDGFEVAQSTVSIPPPAGLECCRRVERGLRRFLSYSSPGPLSSPRSFEEAS